MIIDIRKAGASVSSVPFLIKGEFKDFSIFFETPLASWGRGGNITLVPPYDDFGDWATPKEPAAELFLRPAFFFLIALFARSSLPRESQ
jgi:hypothetical protein